MKLTDLDPHWFVLEEGGPVVGLSFLCPHCQKQRLAIKFHHAANATSEDEYIMARSPDTGHIWTMTGDNFHNLTSSPSVDASHIGHWHGFITDGEIV